MKRSLDVVASATKHGRQGFTIDELLKERQTITVHLTRQANEQWRQFDKLGTEMIVTKTGRRMFPCIQVRLAGMQPDALYSVHVSFKCVDNMRYKYAFRQSKWVIAGPGMSYNMPTVHPGDAESPPRTYRHADSPATGAHWMRNEIVFDKVKLTNNQLDGNAFMILNSMHRYMPQIEVVNVTTDQRVILPLQQLTFMAVTAYQNQQVTQLKIAMNPFAKGFREHDNGATDQWQSCMHLASLQHLHYAMIVMSKNNAKNPQ